MAIKKLDDGRYEVDIRPTGRNGKRIRRKFDKKSEAVAFVLLRTAAAAAEEEENRPVELRRRSAGVAGAENPPLHHLGKEGGLEADGRFDEDIPVAPPGFAVPVLLQGEHLPEHPQAVVGDKAQKDVPRQRRQRLGIPHEIHLRQRGAWPARQMVGREYSLDLPAALLHQRVEDGLLALEVVVNGALLDPHRPGDVPDGYGLVSPDRKQLQRRLGDLFFCRHDLTPVGEV